MSGKKLLPSAAFVFQMKFVQRAMDDRRKDDSQNRNQRETAEQRIATGKNLATTRLQRRHRAHTGKNHRRIYKRIHPRKFFKDVIASHADTERNDDDGNAQRGMARDAPVINFARQQRLRAVLEHKSVRQPDSFR